MSFFKKKIDWSEYSKQKDETVERPKPEVSYPYTAIVSRKSGFLSFQDCNVRAEIRSSTKGDATVSVESMQLMVLQDLRDQLGSLISRMDSLVQALNDNLEDDGLGK